MEVQIIIEIKNKMTSIKNHHFHNLEISGKNEEHLRDIPLYLFKFRRKQPEKELFAVAIPRNTVTMAGAGSFDVSTTLGQVLTRFFAFRGQIHQARPVK